MQVTNALVDALDLAYRYRYQEAATLADLANRDASKLPDRALVFVQSEGVVYRWTPSSLLDELLPFVLRPAVLPLQGNGRWLRQSSSTTLGHAHFRPVHRVRTGYARAIQIYQGEDDEMLERIYGQRPAFLVEWMGDTLDCRGYRHGSIYALELRYIIHCVSRNLRRGPDAVMGSQVQADSGILPDPGLFQMVGDARYLLGGETLGLSPGVKFVDVTGDARIVETDLAQSLFRAELDVKVLASVHQMDEDLLSPVQVWVERRDADAEVGQPFDRDNYVADGYRFSPAAGLSHVPTQGAAYLAGQLVSSQPGAHLFEPNAETYRDLLPSGALVYSAVELGSDPPAQPLGSLRVGVTVTDGDSLVADNYLCSYLVRSSANPGDPFSAA